MTTFERAKAEVRFTLDNVYDDPAQQPSAVYTICHNDDDWSEADHRRVLIEIFCRACGDYEIFAGGEALEGANGICETLAEARYTVELLWGDEVWNLRSATTSLGRRTG